MADAPDSLEKVQTYSRWLRRLPAAAAIERVAADLGLIARACAAEEGDAHAGSLLKAIELVRSVDGHQTVGDYVELMARLVDQTEQYDGVSVRPHAELPVRVMNLHQCKGLEAPFVFLADPAGDSQHDVGVHIDRSSSQPRGYLPIYGRKRGQWEPPPILAQPPDWDRLAAEEQRFLDAEANRLRYVAATRAGSKLVISQRDGNDNRKNPWRMFDDYLQSAEPLADPGTVPAKPAVPLVIDAAEWKQQTDAIDGRWKTISRPTYAVQAIKASALQPGPKPHGAEKAGAEWGDVLHTLLEAAMKQPSADLRGLALSALEVAELPLTLVDDVLATVERVIQSEMWDRAMKSEHCLTEVPVAMPVAAADSPDGLPTVLRGVIDLVFREAAGWAIVDYKSERVGASEIPALVDYYRPQIEAYAEVWQKVVVEPVVERGLCFTHAGEYRVM